MLTVVAFDDQLVTSDAFFGRAGLIRHQSSRIGICARGQITVVPLTAPSDRDQGVSAGIVDGIKGSSDIEDRNLLLADIDCRTRTRCNIPFFQDLDAFSHKFSARISTTRLTD